MERGRGGGRGRMHSDTGEYRDESCVIVGGQHQRSGRGGAAGDGRLHFEKNDAAAGGRGGGGEDPRIQHQKGSGRGSAGRGDGKGGRGGHEGRGGGRAEAGGAEGRKGGGKRGGRKAKNTENFDPDHRPTDMRVIFDSAALNEGGAYSRPYLSNEVIVNRDLFGTPKDAGIFDKLLKEISESDVKASDLWKLWHGDSHLIADDARNWKAKCPTFTGIIDRISRYFNMDVKATRFNYYRDSSEWKPYHHDAAAVKPERAKTQNFTVAISFGAEREASFEHAKTKTTVSVPLPNGSVYVFSCDVNIDWKHGILQVPPEQQHSEGRISIIAWGWVDMISNTPRPRGGAGG
ncbi:hypothetical protein DIPPA_04264 [Diplonema papillatum]|nr:hypothetical protein DIPPA_04264 [Diplonema papillatum]